MLRKGGWPVRVQGDSLPSTVGCHRQQRKGDSDCGCPFSGGPAEQACFRPAWSPPPHREAAKAWGAAVSPVSGRLWAAPSGQGLPESRSGTQVPLVTVGTNPCETSPQAGLFPK